jgi:hypothetical protein
MKAINFTKEEVASITYILENQPFRTLGDMRKLDACIEQLNSKQMDDEYFNFMKVKLEKPENVTLNGNAGPRKIWLSIANKLEGLSPTPEKTKK